MTPHTRSQHDAFAVQDWAWVVAVALIWGSSYLLIAFGVEHFEPALVAFLRLSFGVAVLALIPAARRPVPRSEWRAIALLGIVWLALPFLLFSMAQRSIDSSLAGPFPARSGVRLRC